MDHASRDPTGTIRNVDGIFMKKTMLALALFVLLTHSAASDVLSPEEGAALQFEGAAMFTSFEQGDAQAFIGATHLRCMSSLAGGKHSSRLPAALGQLRRSGLRLLSVEVGEPTRTYQAGIEEVYFVPRTRSWNSMEGRQRARPS